MTLELYFKDDQGRSQVVHVPDGRLVVNLIQSGRVVTQLHLDPKAIRDALGGSTHSLPLGKRP